LDSLKDGSRLLKGEWTSEGRKLLSFRVTEIQAKNSGGLDDDGAIVSSCGYFLQGSGHFKWDPPDARIYVNKQIKSFGGEDTDRGDLFFFTDDDEQEVAQIEMHM